MINPFKPIVDFEDYKEIIGIPKEQLNNVETQNRINKWLVQATEQFDSMISGSGELGRIYRWYKELKDTEQDNYKKYKIKKAICSWVETFVIKGKFWVDGVPSINSNVNIEINASSEDSNVEAKRKDIIQDLVSLGLYRTTNFGDQSTLEQDNFKQAIEDLVVLTKEDLNDNYLKVKPQKPLQGPLDFANNDMTNGGNIIGNLSHAKPYIKNYEIVDSKIDATKNEIIGLNNNDQDILDINNRINQIEIGQGNQDTKITVLTADTAVLKRKTDDLKTQIDEQDNKFVWLDRSNQHILKAPFIGQRGKQNPYLGLFADCIRSYYGNGNLGSEVFITPGQVSFKLFDETFYKNGDEKARIPREIFIYNRAGAIELWSSGEVLVRDPNNFTSKKYVDIVVGDNIHAINQRVDRTDNLVNDVINGLKQLRPFKYVGNFQAGTTYKKNDLVSFNQTLYLSTEDNNTDTPPTNKWLEIQKTVNVDLTDYLTKQEATQEHNAIINRFSNYYTKPEIDAQQNSQDNHIQELYRETERIAREYVTTGGTTEQTISSPKVFQANVDFKDVAGNVVYRYNPNAGDILRLSNAPFRSNQALITKSYVDSSIQPLDNKITSLSNNTLKNNLAGQSIPNLTITQQGNNANEVASISKVNELITANKYGTFRTQITIQPGTQRAVFNIPNNVNGLIAYSIWRRRNDGFWFDRNERDPIQVQTFVDGNGWFNIYNNPNSSGNGTYEYSNDFKVAITYEK